MTMDHVYVPLSAATNLRVLILHPARSRAKPLEISLKEIAYPVGQKRTDYEALSYCWGAKTGDRPLLCDGKELKITANCELTLRYLRYEKKRRTLWVDAICINQADGREKSQQVQMMGDVYHLASRVIVWLGPRDALTASSFRYFRRMQSRLLPERYNYMIYKADEVLSRYFKNASELPRPARDKPAERGNIITVLYQNPYFQRAWTVQELALAQNAVAVCGNNSLEWNRLVTGQTTVWSRLWDELVDDPIKRRELYSAFQDHTQCALLKTMSFNGLEAENLILPKVRILVKTAGSREASDPRDRVWGLYALFLEIGIRLPEPVYDDRSVESVYTEATRALIRETGSLTILDIAKYEERNSSLPSWVQDFCSKRGQDIQSLWRVSPTSRVNVDLLDKGETHLLRLEGVSFATIAHRGASMLETERLPQESNDAELDHRIYIEHYLAPSRTWLELVEEHAPHAYPMTSEPSAGAFFPHSLPL